MNTLLPSTLIGILLGIIALVGWILSMVQRRKASKASEQLREIQKSLVEVESELNQLHETEGIKSKFFVSMSNELRTPLNSILGFSELLLTSETTPEQDEYIQTIQSSGNDLLHVLSNLIDYAHIHARNIVGSETVFDFSQLLYELCLEIEIAAKRKGLTFRIERDVKQSIILKSDKSYLYTLLYNLLENALKFTDIGGVVLRVKTELESRAIDEALIYHTKVEIEDTGIGIPEEELPNIYSAFYQVEREKEGKRGGLGLGLAVVKRLAGYFGGTVEYSLLPTGSKFTLSMSLVGVKKGLWTSERRRPLRMSAERTLVGESFYKLHILVAEDMPSNARLLEIMLGKMGHSFDVAANGQEAVLAAKETNYDVILMDIQMPMLSGTIAAKMIRAGKMGEQNIETPIVALTALASEMDKKDLNAAGINECLTKPVNVGKLRSVLTEIARDRLEDSGNSYSRA